MPPFFNAFSGQNNGKQQYTGVFIDRIMQLTGLEPLVTHLSDFPQTFFKFKVAKMTAILSVLCSRAYFSVQYCTLCAVLMAKCALNVKMCSIEI